MQIFGYVSTAKKLKLGNCSATKRQPAMDRCCKSITYLLTYLLGILDWVIPLRRLAGISAFVWSSAGMMRIWHLLVGGSSRSPLCCWISVGVRLFCKNSSLDLGIVLGAGSETVYERRKGLIYTCYAHIYKLHKWPAIAYLNYKKGHRL